MSEDVDKLKDEFTKHQIENAHFESSTAAYIKNAAEDIRDITGKFTKATDAQWLAIKDLRDGLATEKEERKVELGVETSARKVDDTKLRGRIDGYAKVVGGISVFLGITATILRLVGAI